MDDSPLALRLMTRLLSDTSQVQIVGTAAHGREALALLATAHPDVLCTDDAMPVMDGLELTRRAMAESPLPILVLGENATLSRERRAALMAAGAVEVDVKPASELAFEPAALETAARAMVSRLRRLAGVVVLSRRAAGTAPVLGTALSSAAPLAGTTPVLGAMPTLNTPATMGADKGLSHAVPTTFARDATGETTGSARAGLSVVAVGSSTGGPHALEALLMPLPADFPAPILCVQHISAGFSQGLIEWLNARCALRVTRAAAGHKPQAGSVYFAPEDAHLVLDASGRMAFSPAPLEDGHRPSATMLLRSVAGRCGASAAGVVLTGMGCDGAQGLLELSQAGGLTFAQDEASCVVYGMPAQAVKLGAARYILPPASIAQELLRRARRSG